MATFQFQVFSTTNLIPDPGPPPSQPIATNQTNGNQQVDDTYTVGTEDSQTISIEDNENNFFEDDTDTPQFLDQPLTINGVTYPVGTQVQAEFVLETDQLDPDGDPVLIIALRFQTSGGLETTAYAVTGPLPEGTTFTVVASDNNVTGVAAPEFPDIVCFAAGTMIQVGEGREVPVETLVAGDFVETLDNGPQPVRWIGSRTLGPKMLRASPNLRPIRIRAGALGENMPARDLVVSPQHRVFLKSKIAVRMFDAEEILVPAKHLLGLPGVEIVEDMQSVTYVHAMFDDHEIVRANGALTEALYTGTEAMKALSPEARAEIDEIFGEVPYLDRPPARPVPKGRVARKLVERHVKNEKALV